MKAIVSKKKAASKTVVKENTFPVVAIGASAGGLEAMMELLKYLPDDTGMAFIYVQHLSPDHKSMLTEILSKKTRMIVQEIDDMDKIQPNNVFVIPYNKGIEVTDGHIKLIPRSESTAAISIDILFSDLAKAQKERVIGIILSGSASDGTVGMKAIKVEGGLTFAQDNTAKFQSMPHSAIAAGIVDYILSPKEIALELARLSKHPLIKTIGVKNGEEDSIENTNPDLKIILNHLHNTTGVDFGAYKMNTIKRRIIRRMLLYKIATLKDYAKLLSQNKEEIEILYQDLLINVTSFFRDTDTHKYLKENLLPRLLKSKKAGESLRIWVPACSTGEEAYSIAMMLIEIQESKTYKIPVQIFATDLSERVINLARIGIYTKQDLETVSPKRIQRFFNKSDGGFRVNQTLRDMCVFASHNILHDPPFSRLDFISCCNLFIYFDSPAQKKAINTFHYALNSDGFLMLGKSENISQSATLFARYNAKYKVFSPQTNSGPRTLPALMPQYAQHNVVDKNVTVTNTVTSNQNSLLNQSVLDNVIDAVLVSEFMPASVVINFQYEIVQFRGTTDLFLTHPKGKATLNILKMAHPEIAFELRNAILKVIRTNQRIRKSGIELYSTKSSSSVRIISFEIIPLKKETTEPLLLVIFTAQEQIEIATKSGVLSKDTSMAKDRRILKLEQELAAAHADALAFAQEHEAFTEELQSANEEVVSSNEELQTVNEELETSKEEIEAANEELTTANQELQNRNDQLNEAYDFSEALFATIHEPMLVLDKNLCVKSANKSFYKLFNVNKEQTEGFLLYDLGTQQWNIPSLRELLENSLASSALLHDFEITHTFPIIGEKILLLNARHIIQKFKHEELILLAITDLTEVRRKVLELQNKDKEILILQLNEEKNLREVFEKSKKRYIDMLMQSPLDFAVLKGKDMVVSIANNGFKKMWAKGNEIEGKSLIKILPELKNHKFSEILNDVYTTGIPYTANESLTRLKHKNVMEDRYFNYTYQPYRENDGTISGVKVFGSDVTEQVNSRKIIEQSDRKFRNLVEHAPVAMGVFRGKDFIIEVANEKYLQILGKSREQVLNCPLFTVIPELIGHGLKALMKEVVETGIPFVKNDVSVRLVRYGNEQTIYLNFIFEPLYNAENTIDGVFALAIEVTEQVLARLKLEESQKNLIEAKTAAESATESKQHFLSNMSHEIRTPLNSILGFANVLLNTELNASQNEFVHAIKTSGVSLSLLINDILDLAKVDAGKIIFENQPFELRKSITSILYSFDLNIKEKNLELIEEIDPRIPIMIMGDSIRLNQIILNLLSNAIKFTHNGKIILNVKLLHEDVDSVNLGFSVADTGIGIPSDKMNSIFALFEQAGRTSSNSYGGTGLGLAIVKQLIEAQGGSISVKSKIDEGSVFSFTLPFEKTDVKREIEIEIPHKHSEIKNLRVLVAEDVPLNQLLIKIILSDLGFEFDLVSNGKFAVEQMESNSYDIVLMDLHMPEMDGLEATDYIRKVLKSTVPIIALTADVTTVDVSKCKERGMDDYISKPIDENLLYEKIVKLIMKKL